MLITRLLNKLIQDVQQTRKPYYTQVERACNSALQDIRSVDTDGESEHKVLRQKSMEYEESEDTHDASDNLDLLVGEEVRPQTSVDSEKFFIPFELACKGDVIKITASALDGIQKLVAYGEIVGDYPDPRTPSRRLIDRIVDTICSCHSDSDCDEAVELQIIKALLTIVTSEQVQVHESTMLLILRTCCIIHLTTKSIVNQRTARAMLTQMLHSIFQRMEITAEELELQLKNGNNSYASSAKIEEFGDFQEWEAECIALVVECLSRSILSVSNDHNKHIALNAQSNQTVPQEPSRDINQNSEKCLDQTGDHVGDGREFNGEHTSPEERGPDDPNNFAQVQEHVTPSDEDSLNPFLNDTTKTVCFSTTNNLINDLKKDAFLSFWTLTKLAIKPLVKSPTDGENDKTAIENKIQQSVLAFHLLKEILEKSGRVFKDSPIFSNAMRQYLFNAMKENGISANAEIFKLQVEMFMILLTKFNDILVEEIQDLLNLLIFPILETPSSYLPEYSRTVLRCLNSISSNLDCFVHLYVSYDYNAEIEERPFQKIATCLNKIIRDKLGNEELAVQIIANLLKSMSTACPKLEDNHDNTKTIRGTSSLEETTFEDEIIQNLELEGKDFLTCLHTFLANVELPCEALKLDWCVQKVAQKMTDTSSVNNSKTETADCWYALIYASMSLIADIKITKCQGKSKMSRSQFIKLNRAINGCEPLDETCISSIYDEIEDNYKRDAGCNDDDAASDQIKWLASVGKNEKEILNVIKYILESTSLLRSHFSLGRQLKHVKRMIKLCGTSFLMALISALQNTNDTKLSDVCLDGIHSGIRVACILGLDNEREAFVQILAKLSASALDEIRGKNISSKIVTKTTSTLTMTENGVTKTVVTTTTEMKCRSVDIILTLLDVGIAEGNHLGGSWLHILKFISQLLSTSLLAESRNSSRSSSPVPPLQTASVTGGSGTSTTSGWAAWAGSLRESLEKKLWDPTAKALHPSVKESIANSVEKVFKRSEMLTGDAMTEFFQALCQVSLHDMMNSEAPKHLMYEKINEVADGNFYRPALQWSQIWQVVADYFCHLACSSKEEISTLAIDSIQKLVLKLLKKETVNGYRFQNHYLSPFKVILTNSRSQSTREAVLGFVETVISLHGDLLLSGWIAVLSILVANMLSHTNAAADSFRVLQHIVDKCQKGEVNLRNSFGSIVKSLIDIAGYIAPTLEMSEQAFRLLTQLAEIPYRHPQLLIEENDDKRHRVWARGWKPILCELSAIIVSSTINGATSNVSNSSSSNGNNNPSPNWDIKTKALITLFEVVKTYGSSFEKEWWNSVFEILFNIFNCIKSHEKQDMVAFSISTSTAQLLPSSSTSPPPSSPPPSTSDGSYKYFYCYYYVQFAIFDVYIQYNDATDLYVFDELLKHLQWCICQDHEQIALSGVSCLQQLVVTLGKRFSVNQWDTILNVFQTICKPEYSSAAALLQSANNLECEDDEESQMSQPPAIRAIIHLELLKIMDKVIFPGRKSSLALSPENMENCSDGEVVDEVSSTQINALLTSNQVTIILQILNRCHEISKEHCILASGQNDDSTNEGRHETTNFIPHETLSLQIYWKMLFALFKTDSPETKHGIGKEALWEMIQQSCVRSCGYFITIQMHEHRSAWTDLLCFALASILKFPKPNFEIMTSQLYPYFCEMMELDLLDSKICDTLRKYLLVVGKDYGVTSYDISSKINQGAFIERDCAYDSVSKNSSSGAHQSQFQRTCITNSVNETFFNQPKDFQ